MESHETPVEVHVEAPAPVEPAPVVETPPAPPAPVVVEPEVVPAPVVVAPPPPVAPPVAPTRRGHRTASSPSPCATGIPTYRCGCPDPRWRASDERWTHSRVSSPGSHRPNAHSRRRGSSQCRETREEGRVQGRGHLDAPPPARRLLRLPAPPCPVFAPLLVTSERRTVRTNARRARSLSTTVAKKSALPIAAFVAAKASARRAVAIMDRTWIPRLPVASARSAS